MNLAAGHCSRAGRRTAGTVPSSAISSQKKLHALDSLSQNANQLRTSLGGCNVYETGLKIYTLNDKVRNKIVIIMLTYSHVFTKIGRAHV